MARLRPVRSTLGLIASLAVSGAFALAGAQQQQTLLRGQTPGPRFMVPVLRSQEGNLGVQAAEAIRSRMMSEFPGKTLWIVPKTDIENTLKQSGYPLDQALSTNDTRALAQLLRAEEYVEGTVTRTPAGIRIDANLMIPRGLEGYVQPLPPIEAANLGAAARTLTDHVESARKQLDAARNCSNAVRQKNFPEAMKQARAAIGAYPNSVMGRVCLADIYYEQKLGADSILRVSEEIIKLHPTNRRALALAADAYAEKKDDEKYIQTLTTLLAADPTNTRLQTTVVNALAGSGKANLARPIIDDAVKQNPGDPQLIRLQWLVYLALREYKDAIRIGEEMVRTDTAMADTSFYVRLAGAYAADSQFQKGAEAVARGLQKFPDQPDLLSAQIDLLTKAGQLDQAVEVSRRVLARNPKTPLLNLQVARIFVDRNQPDSAGQYLRNAVAAGDSAALVGAYALSVGNQVFGAAAGNQNADAVTKANDFKKSLEFIALADSLAPSDNSKFLRGVANLSLGQQLLQQASDRKSCEIGREAKNSFADAQIYIPQGGRAFPDQARQALAGLTTLDGYADRIIKAYCK